MISLLEFLLTEQRDEIPFLGHIPCFRELRSNAGLSEAKRVPFVVPTKAKPKKTPAAERNRLPDFDDWAESGYDDPSEIHDHPKVRKGRISNSADDDLGEYTQADSRPINQYLHKMSQGKAPKRHTSTYDHAVRIMSLFNPKNTNRMTVSTYSGVPPTVGEQLASSKKGSQFHLPAFTSTSTDRWTAATYAEGASQHAHWGRDDYDTFNEVPGLDHHIIHFNVLAPKRKGDSGAGMTIADNSHHGEDEFLLHPGAKITYKGTKRYQHFDGNVVHVHQVDVHPLSEAKPLSKYPSETARKGKSK